MGHQKTVETTIKVNEYIKMTITLPEEMDASEFFGLMSVAKKAANIEPLPELGEKTMSKGKKWSEQDEQTLKDMWDFEQTTSQNSARIGKALGRKPSTVNARYYKRREELWDNKDGELWNNYS